MRAKYSEFIIEGKRLTGEALRSSWDIQYICIAEEKADQLPFAAGTNGTQVYTLPEKEFAEISTTEHSQGVIAVAAQKHFTHTDLNHSKSDSIMLALDAIADPGNTGTIIRSADWFGADSVLLGEGCAELYNPKTVRSTMGSIFRVPAAEHVNLFATLQDLRKHGYAVYAATTSDQPIGKRIRFAPKSVLLIGSESEGIRHELLGIADHKITIKKYGGGESLNAAMAASVALALAREFAGN